MQKQMFLIAASAVIFGVFVTVSTALSEEKVLSLKEAVGYAMTGNPEIRAEGEGLLAQNEEIGIARSFLLPKLNFEERFMRTNNPTYAFMAKLNQKRFSQQDFEIGSLNNPSAINDFQTGLSFEQPLFAPKAILGVTMAKKEFSAKGDEFERKKEEISFSVLKAYVGVQTAKAYAGAAEKGIEDAKEHFRIAQARYESGLGLYSDTLRAKVALSSAEEKLVSANKNRDVAKRALGLMLGLTESVDVSDERPVFDLKMIEYYYTMSMSRKDLKSLETRYKNAENMLKMADAGYLPVIGVGGSYQLNDHSKPFGAEGDSWQVAAFLRWELFDGTKREHERKKAKYKIAETQEYLDGFKKELSFHVYESYLGVEEARKGLELARSALESSEEGRRLVRVRYENSLAPIVDLLDAQTNLDSSRANVIEREGAYLTTIVNLEFQSGTILKELGVEQGGNAR
jgi:outer membrane protein